MSSREYYQTRFPWSCVHAFATLGSEGYPERVEFSIEAIDAAGDDFRRRHIACKTHDDLRRVVNANDVRALPVGGIYPDDVQRSRGKHDQKARQKLLAFDIDLQDYDFLSASAADQVKNDRSWALVAGGLCILRELLQSKFGFKCFLPVYSGRRGAHLWVLDARAIAASDAARDAICCNITPPPAKGGDAVPRFATVLAGLDGRALRVAEAGGGVGGGVGEQRQRDGQVLVLVDAHAAEPARLIVILRGAEGVGDARMVHVVDRGAEHERERLQVVQARPPLFGR